jgi:septum formation protein
VLDSAVISPARPLVLGSASPRRRELLAGLRLPFRIEPAEVDEDLLPDEMPSAYLDRIVQDKLAAVAARVEPPLAAILVADTTVVLGDELLGKPADVEEAAELLHRIAGRTHVVLTRYAIARADTPAEPAAARTVLSRVTMRAASGPELVRYARTGEGLDKAGAYAAQGIGAFLVERIDGSYTNVIGLPVCEVVVDLRRLGLLDEFP